MRKHLVDIVNEYPEASLVKNKYLTLCRMLKMMYPEHYEKIPTHVWEDIVFDAVNGDREWRMLTQGKDQINKDEAEQEWLDENYPKQDTL